MEWRSQQDFFYAVLFGSGLSLPPTPTGTGNPAPSSGTRQAQLLLDMGTAHSSRSRLCSCQEFLGADRMRCWLKWHGTPRNAWQHMDPLPGGMPKPCQVPIEFQACATLCSRPAAVEQAGWSRIQRSSCCGVRLRILWWRWLGWQMEEGEACFLDILQPFYIFAVSRIWSKISAMKIFLHWVYIWALSHLKSQSLYFISISSSGRSLAVFLSSSLAINQPRNELTSKEGYSWKCSIIFRL